MTASTICSSHRTWHRVIPAQGLTCIGWAPRLVPLTRPPARKTRQQLGVLGASQGVLLGVRRLMSDGTSGKAGQYVTIALLPEVPLRTQSATTTITDAATVAAGVVARAIWPS